jgi:hypothetical protein
LICTGGKVYEANKATAFNCTCPITSCASCAVTANIAKCTSCKAPNLLFQNTCVARCPSPTVPKNGVCV